jgi:hypothetical protein
VICVPAGPSATLSVDGSPGTISPGRGRFTRGSFRVDARVDDVQYRLTPSDADGSALLCDGKRLGQLMQEPETIELMAVWTDNAEVQPRDAAVGYALATAFDTGAEHTFVMLFEVCPGSSPAAELTVSGRSRLNMAS